MAKRRAKNQIVSLTPDQKKLGIDPIYLASKGMPHNLESSQQELQLCFILHLDPKSTCKIMGLQSCGSLNRRDFGTPTRESRERKTIWI